MILIVLISLSLVGTEQNTLIQKSETFAEHFNQRDFKSVHKMFSVEMKQALPLAQLEEVLSQFSKQYGVITEKEFLRYENTYGIFKAEFLKTLEDNKEKNPDRAQIEVDGPLSAKSPKKEKDTSQPREVDVKAVSPYQTKNNISFPNHPKKG